MTLVQTCLVSNGSSEDRHNTRPWFGIYRHWQNPLILKEITAKNSLVPINFVDFGQIEVCHRERPASMCVIPLYMSMYYTDDDWFLCPTIEINLNIDKIHSEQIQPFLRSSDSRSPEVSIKHSFSRARACSLISAKDNIDLIQVILTKRLHISVFEFTHDIPFVLNSSTYSVSFVPRRLGSPSVSGELWLSDNLSISSLISRKTLLEILTMSARSWLEQL